MSLASTSELAGGVRIQDVVDFLILMGYTCTGTMKSDDVGPILCLDWFDEKDYHSWYGVHLGIYENQSKVIVESSNVFTANYFDLSHLNKTLRLLRKHFGGSFTTDEGKGRYFKCGYPPFEPAASGCHLAFQRFGENLFGCMYYFGQRRYICPKPKGQSGKWFVHVLNAWAVSNNLLLPFLLAIAEDFWKSTYIALLKYSDRKESILKSNRLTSGHLCAISQGKTSVENAFAETLSFQRVSTSCKHFLSLDPKLDFASTLRKPYRHRKLSLYDSLEEMTDLRHGIIHRAQLSGRVTDQYLDDTMHDLLIAVDRCYRLLTKTYDWVYIRNWEYKRRKPRQPLNDGY